MDTQTIYIGTVETLSSGRTQDNRRPVTFEGEQLATRTEYGYDSKRGHLTDTRGVTETLYRTADGRMVVHVKDWSQWQGEPNTESLHEVSEGDLQAGAFEALGREAGLGRPLTLAEALEK
jgi:hypothetical protein